MRPLALVSFLGFTSFFLTLASLAVWAVRGGTSPSTAGAGIAAMLASTVIFQTVIPALERRWGVTAALGGGLIALGAPAPLYALSQHLNWLILISVVRGAGFASLTVLGGMLITRIAPPSRHSEVVGVYGLSVALPNLAAVPAGVALALSGHFEWVAILASSPLLALPLLSGLRAALGPRHVAATLAGSPSGKWAAACSALGPSAVLGAVTIASGGLITFLPIDRPHGPVAPTALLIVGTTVALSRWRAAAWWRRFNRWLAVMALSAAALGMLVAAAALHGGSGIATAIPILAGAALFGTGYGITQNLTMVAAFDRAGGAHAITASAVWNVAFDAGTAVGAYGVGAIAATGLGLPWTYTGCMLIIAVTIPYATRTLAVGPRRSNPPPLA